MHSLEDTQRVFRNRFEKATQNRHEIGRFRPVSVPADAESLNVWKAGMFFAEDGPQKLVQLQWVQGHVAVDAWHHERLHVFANERQVALVTARDQVLNDPYLQFGWQGEEVCRGLGWIFDLAAG